MTCRHCGNPTADTVTIRKKWVSHGPVEPYPKPLELPCCKSCRDGYLTDRSRYFAVLDETMNTHRDFVRVNGQDGYVVHNGERVPCKGWQTAGEVGVPYRVHERYAEYG